MYRFKKMRMVSLLVVLVMAFGLVPLAAPQGASADISAVSKNLQAVYFWLGKDPSGATSVVTAANNFNSNLLSTIESLVWPDSDPTQGTSLPITPGIAAKFGGIQTAKDDIAQLIIDMSRPRFAIDEGTALGYLIDLDTNTTDKSTVATLTSEKITLDNIVAFLSLAESSGISYALTQSSNWQQILQSENMSAIRSLIDTITSDALKYAGDNGYSNVYNALSGIGWSIQALSDAVMQVDQQVDPNSQAEIALLKAFVRSQACVNATPPMTAEESLSLAAGTSEQLSITIFGTVATGLSLESSNTTEVSVSGNTITGVSATTTPVEITAYYNNPATDWAYKAMVTVTGSSNNATTTGGGGGGPQPNSLAVTSTTGSAAVNPAGGGTISLGTYPSIYIPAGALVGTNPVTVAIQPVSNPPAAPGGFMMLGNAYDFTFGGAEHYTFNAPVTITLSFDPASVPAGATPVVYYYDSTSNQWVALFGTVSGNTIKISISHCTTYAVMVQQAPPPVPAPPVPQGFSDVTGSYWASDVIALMSTMGYVYGYPDGTFRPNGQITRAEFVTIIDKALKLSAYTPATPGFSDISPGGWYYGSVGSAVYAGITKGYVDNMFRPDGLITRQEIAVILVNALGKAEAAQAMMGTRTSFTDDAGIAAWARGYVAEASQAGLIKGYPDGSFGPGQDATRAEACVVISNLLTLLGRQ